MKRVLFLVFLCFIQENILSQADDKVLDISKNWEYTYHDFLFEKKELNISEIENFSGWKEIEKPNNPPDKENHSIAWFRKKIPDFSEISDPRLFIDVSKDCEIFLDGQKIYTFGKFQKNQWPGWDVKFLQLQKPLPKFLYVRMFSSTHNIGFHSFKIGSYGSLFYRLVKDNQVFFFIGFFYVIISIFTTLIYLSQPSQKILLSFSVFTFCSGLYLLAIANPLVKIYFDNSLFWPYVLYVSLYFLPVGILSFTEDMIGEGKYRITRFFIFIHIGFALFAIGLSFLEVVHLETTLPIFQFLLLAAIIVHIGRISYHSWIGNPEGKIFSIGALLYILTVIVDLYRAVSSNVAFDGISHWGAFLFIVSLALILKRRFLHILRQTKAQAKELEEKVKERTKELNNSLTIIKKDLATAKKIQENILPHNYRKIEKMNFIPYYSPMSEVGGDFFDVEEVQKNIVRVFLADATGHGVQGALVTMAIKGEYESLKWSISNPAELLEVLNRKYYLKYRALNSFFSCVIVDINFDFYSFQYAAAGHPNQIFIKNGSQNILEKTGKLVGILKDSTYSTVEFQFSQNDRLFLFTDGAFEQFDFNGHAFGESRLLGLFSQKNTIESISELFQAELANFLKAKPKQDDATILSIEFR